ncbi:hypothetical protein Msi02_78010 [Microbispora siamensis]|uniref:Uncharacterized protein n=1 Tax=Microbispora siamensis TaxID=564413 RepID=A0ABQ4GZW6_9ACTN|nr:hypothetical protein Msi02_78010 [Microbispora siamensis]
MILAWKYGVSDDSVHTPVLWVPNADKDDTAGTASPAVADVRLVKPTVLPVDPFRMPSADDVEAPLARPTFLSDNP